MTTFGQRIKQLREESNLNQEQLAEQFSVKRSTISKWEGDKAVPGTTAVIKIANYFNVSTDFYWRLRMIVLKLHSEKY